MKEVVCGENASPDHLWVFFLQLVSTLVVTVSLFVSQCQADVNFVVTENSN